MKIDANKAYENINKSTEPVKANKVQSEGKPLAKGDVIQGEIKDIRQDSVTVKLSDGSLVNAKTSQDFQFTIGQEVTFTVKENSDEALVIKPMFKEGELTNATLLKILENANKNLTKQNVEVVLKLMDNNMPVDSKNLTKAISYVNHFKGASIDDVLFLLKNDIKVTEQSLEQLENFKNSDQQISKSISSLSEGISKLPLSSEATQLTNVLLKENAVIGKIFNLLNSSLNFTESLNQGLAQSQSELSGSQSMEMMPQNQNNIPGQNELEQLLNRNNKLQSNVTNPEPNSSEVLNKNMTINEWMTGKDIEVLQEKIDNVLQEYSKTNEVNLGKTLLSVMKEPVTINGKNVSEIFEVIRNNQFPSEFREEIFKVLREDMTRSMVNKEMLMDKEVLNDPKAYNQYYEKLSDKFEEIINQQRNITDTKIAEVIDEAKDVKTNIEFMSDLNKNFNYFQFPMLLGNQVLNSELYVFNNKSQLKKNTGAITALVRLDLVNLGHIDAYVVKENNNIDCKFYIEDTEEGNRLNEHLSKLNVALSAAGFNVTSISIVKKDIDFNIMGDFLQQETKNGDLKRVSFDMRA